MVVVDKPPWVTHNGESIFSVHVSPRRSERMATGGGDHCVRVWSMEVVRSMNAELKDKGKEGLGLLATLRCGYIIHIHKNVCVYVSV